MTEVLAIVPARGGSKGIANKNMHPVAGKPLIEWTLDVLDQSHVQRGVVSTDDDSIIAFVNSRDWDTTVYRCPLIPDDAQIEGRLDPIIKAEDPDIIVLLQPTSPVRTGHMIDEAIEQLQRDGADSLLSVVPSHALFWSKPQGVPDQFPYSEFQDPSYDVKYRPRRQDLSPQYEENGSIYVFTREHWERTHNRLGGQISLYVMPEYCRVQVDTPYDLWLAHAILTGHKETFIWPPSQSQEERLAPTTPPSS